MSAAPRVHELFLPGGARIEAWDEGEGPGPPLVLVPGVAGGKEIFAKCLPRLAARRRVIALDLSPRVSRRPVDGAVFDLLAALDNLGVARADLLGQSFGAVVAARVAATRPERVRALVLASPAAFPAMRHAAPVLWRWAFFGSVLRVWPRRSREGAARWIERRGGYAIEPGMRGADLDALFERVKRTPIVPLLRRLAGLRTHSWPQELEPVRAPMLILEGDREWAIVPPRVRAAFEANDRARIAVLPGGHMPFITNDTEFCERVTSFLETAAPERAYS